MPDSQPAPEVNPFHSLLMSYRTCRLPPRKTKTYTKSYTMPIQLVLVSFRKMHILHNYAFLCSDIYKYWKKFTVRRWKNRECSKSSKMPGKVFFRHYNDAWIICIYIAYDMQFLIFWCFCDVPWITRHYTGALSKYSERYIALLGTKRSGLRKKAELKQTSGSRVIFVFDKLRAEKLRKKSYLSIFQSTL